MVVGSLVHVLCQEREVRRDYYKTSIQHILISSIAQVLLFVPMAQANSQFED